MWEERTFDPVTVTVSRIILETNQLNHSSSTHGSYVRRDDVENERIYIALPPRRISLAAGVVKNSRTLEISETRPGHNARHTACNLNVAKVTQPPRIPFARLYKNFRPVVRGKARLSFSLLSARARSLLSA